MLKADPKVRLRLLWLKCFSLVFQNLPVLQYLNRSSLVGNCFQDNDTSNRPLQQCMVIYYILTVDIL
jgi:hypothetical protein